MPIRPVKISRRLPGSSTGMVEGSSSQVPVETHVKKHAPSDPYLAVQSVASLLRLNPLNSPETPMNPDGRSMSSKVIPVDRCKKGCGFHRSSD
jgi:hypothetical protein